MCGIVGYVGAKNAESVIVSGLKRLEYRGYDSAGISIIGNDGLSVVRSVGKLAALEEKLSTHHMGGNIGIGHTRWATHGAPTELNCHPHLDQEDAIALVHNGIIENYGELRESLKRDGVHFRSETDTETMVHLIRRHYSGDLFTATQRALQEVRGAYAIAVINRDNPDVIVAARQGSPLVIGVGDHEMLVASDVPALIEHTRNVIYMDDGQIFELRADGYRVEDLDGREQQVTVNTVDWDDTAAEKMGFPHFMLKEIHEQPESIRNTLRGRISEDRTRVNLDDAGIRDSELEDCTKIVFVACGTAWHACLAGKYLIESIAGVPVEVDSSSEYRYRDPLVPPGTIVIPVTQSGETADTLEAVRIAKQKGAHILAIVNVVGSSIARASDSVLYLQAGPEIGVASTKAYTSQLTALSLLAIYVGQVRGTIDEARSTELIAQLLELPDKVQQCLDNTESIQHCADLPLYRDALSTFFLGRRFNYPSALEGALKLTEISYIHAEGFRAGEMKHGPIALITNELPSVCIVTQSGVYEKMISNIQEIKARGGIILAIATEGDEHVKSCSDHVIYVPPCEELFSPIVVAVPLQLLAYYIAVNRGCDVDQPRNLAKSVTVE